MPWLRHGPSKGTCLTDVLEHMRAGQRKSWLRTLPHEVLFGWSAEARQRNSRFSTVEPEVVPCQLARNIRTIAIAKSRKSKLVENTVS
jgi:hypothetical protein